MTKNPAAVPWNRSMAIMQVVMGTLRPAQNTPSIPSAARKLGVDSDEATDPTAERRTDAKQGCDLASLEAGAQGERRHHELDGCVGKGRVTGEPGAREPGGKAGILPGVEHRVGREHHERAHECASQCSW